MIDSSGSDTSSDESEFSDFNSTTIEFLLEENGTLDFLDDCSEGE